MREWQRVLASHAGEARFVFNMFSETKGVLFLKEVSYGNKGKRNCGC